MTLKNSNAFLSSKFAIGEGFLLVLKVFPSHPNNFNILKIVVAVCQGCVTFFASSIQ